MQDIELILIAVGALLLIVSALLGRRKGAEPESPAPPMPAPDVSPEGAVELKASLAELLRDLQELNDDMTADLEDKLAELKEALEEADNKLEEMSAAGIGQNPPEEPSEEPSQKPSDATRPEPPARTAAAPEPRWPSESEESQEPQDSQEPLEPREREESIAMSSPTGRYGEIYRLEDGGLPVEEIARRMNMGKGEIQLILSLREKD